MFVCFEVVAVLCLVVRLVFSGSILFFCIRTLQTKPPVGASRKPQEVLAQCQWFKEETASLEPFDRCSKYL